MSRKIDPKYETPWRKSATAIYKKARDGRVYGTFELEMDAVMEYIAEHKKNGRRITITQVVMAAVGRAIALDIPDVNAFIRRGHIVPRDNVSLYTAVSKGGKNEIGGLVVKNLENKSIFDIADEMDSGVKDARKMGSDKGAAGSKNMLASLPWPLRNWVLNLVRWMHIELGWEIKAFKLSHNSFGSGMVTNIGTHYLQYGFPALLPIGNIPFVMAIGRIEKRPVVRNDEIVIRNIMPVAAVLDHRLFDGAQGGILAGAVFGYMMDPKCLETPPVKVESKED